MDGCTTSERPTWKTEIRTGTLYEDYVEFSQKIGVKRRVTQSAFGKELKTLIPDFERCRITKGKIRYWVYRIPALEACRRHFDLLTRSERDWPVDD